MGVWTLVILSLVLAQTQALPYAGLLASLLHEAAAADTNGAALPAPGLPAPASVKPGWVLASLHAAQPSRLQSATEETAGQVSPSIPVTGSAVSPEKDRATVMESWRQVEHESVSPQQALQVAPPAPQAVVNGPVPHKGLRDPQSLTPATQDDRRSLDGNNPIPEDQTGPAADGQGRYALPDPQAAVQQMLDLINTARLAAGASEVTLDDLASAVAQAHAVEMAESDYLSHWNAEGYGPDIRYNLAGGSEKAQENIYSFVRYEGSSPAALSDWEQQIESAFAYLMSSPLHRANILAKEHTQVGIGLAYNPENGEFRVVQMFVNRQVELTDAPHSAQPGETLTLRGALLQSVDEMLVNLAYEPFPTGKSLAELRQTIPYASRASTLGVLTPTWGANGAFDLPVTLPETPGLYHVRIWLTIEGRQFLASDLILWVAAP